MKPGSPRGPRSTPPPPIAGPVPELPTHSEDGVDLTLIRWMLSLTPAERLASLENLLDLQRSVRATRD